jgi:serine protease SohB
VEFLHEYGVFLAKTVTVLIALLIIFAAAFSGTGKGGRTKKAQLKVEKLNEEIEETKRDMESHILDKEALKALDKQDKKTDKQKKKEAKKASKDAPIESRSRVYVLEFDGDIKASAVDTFRQAVSAVIQIADPAKDKVLVKLESAGGMVHSYGLAAAQLDRLKQHELDLTVIVDKVAASGGYMMACVADKIVASPFAIMGSIGVVAQLPNFNKLLKKNDIDYEVLTAGEFKRTLTMFGENTDKGRQKFQDDLEDTHELFKAYVAQRRPAVDIDKVATGDIWFGSRALEVNLVDELATSDEYIMQACNDADVYSVAYKEKQNLADKLGFAVSRGITQAITKIFSEVNVSKGMR